MRNDDLINILSIYLPTYVDLLKLDKSPLLEDILNHIAYGVESIKGKEHFSTLSTEYTNFQSADFPLENSKYLEKCSIHTCKIESKYTSLFRASIKGYPDSNFAIRIDNYGSYLESQIGCNIMQEIWKNYGKFL